jgi:type IV secretion system protein VirB9
MSTRQTVIRYGAALMFALMASTALSAELPTSCGPDPRKRCVSYNANQIVSLPLTPGATVLVQLPENEVVFYAGTSDNSIISGRQASERVSTGQSSTADPNLEITVPGGENGPTQFFTVKAKQHLEPQPFSILGIWTNPVTGKEEYRSHVFELTTLAGGPSAPDSFFNLVFRDPVSERLIRDDQRKKKLREIEAETVAARLSQVEHSVLKLNLAYDGQGLDSDRQALAPSAAAGLDAMWDDGERTFLRYPGNRNPPTPYEVLADGTEALLSQNTVVDPATKGSLLIINRVVPMMRLRSGTAVLCITNNAYDPVGRNTGTGTVDPGIIREIRKPS